MNRYELLSSTGAMVRNPFKIFTVYGDAYNPMYIYDVNDIWAVIKYILKNDHSLESILMLNMDIIENIEYADNEFL